MHVVVCVKQIPDPSLAGRLDPETRCLVREGVEVVLDPGDEVGVEAALRVAEATSGEVTVVSMGPEKGLDAIRKALAMGAHRAVLVSDPRLRGSDALATARVLAAAILPRQPDLVIAGTESTDGYTGTVPAAIAELLDWPALTFAKAITVEDATVRIQRQTEVGHDIVEAPLPAVVTVTGGANQPRYPSLRGIMAARAKPVDRPGLEELGIDPATVGLAGANQQVVAVAPAPERAAGAIVTDDGSGGRRIVDYLAELKVI
ncbi:MAG TPA: electron transfer flavoprotein subunit beta/FixA family protein [Candidatus Micrarchaeia archaeon]|nr:electron transfer flavoprotein subunit beta/FixA family protein [Candidatus Micrarchaeia archaeon]